MKPGKNSRLFPLAVGIVVALFSLACISDCMRESDQASVLSGSWQLAHGSPIVKEAYYNYDKLYETYWITAAAYQVRSWFGGTWSPVWIGNISTGLTFWAATLAAFILLAVRGRRLPLLALFCFVSTPTILLNSVYTNPAIVSAGFAVLTGALLITARSKADRWLGALSFFVAVGARADAILLAPLLIWIQMPAHNWIRGTFKSAAFWQLAGAVVAASVLGLALYTGDPLYAWPVFMGIKILGGYLVFGLGASLALLVLFSAVLVAAAVRASNLERRAFHVLGLIALLAPMLYYVGQLWSPRYLVTTAVAVFLFSASRRGQALLEHQRMAGPVVRPLRLVFSAAALALLFIGLRLPSPAMPRITFSRPTLFPTADGLHPMGAYLNFLLRISHVAEREIDHNQLVWAAAKVVSYQRSSDGLVHVLNTPMTSYLELAVTLQGKQAKIVTEMNGTGPVYSETRTFMRVGSVFAPGEFASLLRQPAAIVSPTHKGIAVVRFNAGGDLAWGVRTRALDSLFMGNEYRVYDVSILKSREDMDRECVLVSEQPFEVDSKGERRHAMPDLQSGFYYLSCNSNDGQPLGGLVAARPENVTVAIQVLPKWMSAATH